MGSMYENWLNQIWTWRQLKTSIIFELRENACNISLDLSRFHKEWCDKTFDKNNEQAEKIRWRILLNECTFTAIFTVFFSNRYMNMQMSANVCKLYMLLYCSVVMRLFNLPTRMLYIDFGSCVEYFHYELDG